MGRRRLDLSESACGRLAPASMAAEAADTSDAALWSGERMNAALRKAVETG
jgi:hypothetical protein